MSGSPEWQQLLEDGDVAGLRAAWKRLAPKAKQPKDHHDAEITMHMARTAAELVSMKARLYSHKWLTERMLPSQLPADLVAEYERPRIAEAVGISVNFHSVLLKPAALEVRTAMENAVNECYADGKTQVPVVQRHMLEARDKTLKALFGRA
jgi:hypothetical protein